jgi:hypothetical protein
MSSSNEKFSIVLKTNPEEFFIICLLFVKAPLTLLAVVILFGEKVKLVKVISVEEGFLKTLINLLKLSYSKCVVLFVSLVLASSYQLLSFVLRPDILFVPISE